MRFYFPLNLFLDRIHDSLHFTLLLSSIRGLGFDFKRMDAAILHGLAQRVVDQAVPIQEIFSFEHV